MAGLSAGSGVSVGKNLTASAGFTLPSGSKLQFGGFGGSGVPPPLNGLTASAAAAFSTRLLRSAYTGKAMNVRRSSDNAAQDIGFVNGVLDTASLLAFVGANNGFVTTWYDQSGNGRDVAQATAANQPQIVSSGAVTLLNSVPALTGVTNGALNTSAAATWLNGTPYTISCVAQPANTTSTFILCGTNGASTNVELQIGPYNGNVSNNWIIGQFGNDANIPYLPNTNPFVSTSMRFTSGSQLWLNGTSIGTNANPVAYLSTSGAFNVMNTNNSQFFQGKYGELVVFTSSLSTTDRQSLEGNQQTYYNISSTPSVTNGILLEGSTTSFLMLEDGTSYLLQEA
jgi:hypothetical protein